MRVDEWFFPFIVRHIQRCPSQGWPPVTDAGPENEPSLHFYGPWITRFTREGVKEDAAEIASQSMASSGETPYPGGKHLDMLMKHVHAAWDVLRARGVLPAEGETWEQVQLRCRRCPECCGCGLTSRKRNLPDRKFPHSYSFYCMCPAGRKLAGLHYAQCREVFDRIRHLAQHPELWDSSKEYHLFPNQPDPRPFAIEPGWVLPEPLPPSLLLSSAANSWSYTNIRNIGKMPPREDAPVNPAG